jgi:hypothetical protein
MGVAQRRRSVRQGKLCNRTAAPPPTLVRPRTANAATKQFGLLLWTRRQMLPCRAGLTTLVGNAVVSLALMANRKLGEGL